MKLPRLCAAAAVTIFALFCAGSASADPRGLWLAQDGAHVKVGPCGAALCATIASPKSAVDPETGRPWTDKYNPDPAQRGRPLVGVTKIGSMKLPRLCAAAAVTIFAPFCAGSASADPGGLWLASLFSMGWCRMARGVGPGGFTMSTTGTVTRDVSLSLAPQRSASKAARSASAAAGT